MAPLLRLLLFSLANDANNQTSRMLYNCKRGKLLLMVVGGRSGRTDTILLQFHLPLSQLLNDCFEVQLRLVLSIWQMACVRSKRVLQNQYLEWKEKSKSISDGNLTWALLASGSIMRNVWPHDEWHGAVFCFSFCTTKWTKLNASSFSWEVREGEESKHELQSLGEM